MSSIQLLVNNLLGNLQLKIVSDLLSEHAILKNFPGGACPPPFTQQNVQNFGIVPSPWPDHFRIASSSPEVVRYTGTQIITPDQVFLLY